MASSNCSETVLKTIGKVLCSPVVEIIFTNVVIRSCDGSDPIPFSDARIDFLTGNSVFLSWFWHESICRILKNKIASSTSIKSSDDIAFNCLTSYLGNDNHKKHLETLKVSLTEAEIQSVLAHHLFAPLVPSSRYKIDAKHQHLDKCFACKERSCIGDTSLGHVDVWHGYADILIEKSTVKVSIQSAADDQEENESFEPATKMCKRGGGYALGSDSEGSSDECIGLNGSVLIEDKKGNINDALPQVFAQTIVNAFCEIKNNPVYEDFYIPSFLATATTITVHMYNCKRDRLFSSDDLPIFDQSGNVNVDTIITVWLALNFDKLANIVPDDNFEQMNIPKCQFRKAVGSSFSLYQNEMSKPLVNADRKRTLKRNFAKIAFPKTDYFIKMIESVRTAEALCEEHWKTHTIPQNSPYHKNKC